MRTLRLTLFLILVLPLAAFAQDRIDTALLDAKASLNTAYVLGDLDGLQTAKATFVRALGVDGLTPRQAAAAHYYAALADYRTAGQMSTADAEKAADHLEAANEHLDALLDLDDAPADFRAEANVLRSGVYGQLSGMRPMRAMLYGPRSNRAMEAAKEHDPDNPRALLLDGLSKFYKPAMFGGDKEAAQQRFQRAADLASTRTQRDPLLPTWGHPDAYAFLGQALLEVGQPELARAAYLSALEIEPEYSWVKYSLLPALDSQ